MYKLARGRTKPGAEAEQERKIELFGKWQTEIYVPPPVVDGKIPKNEFGNVELFQEFMLPAGAAHVDIPGGANVARKLGIDYALAMVGWEFHGIACHPVFKGVVVAAENEQTLLDAWRAGEEAKQSGTEVTRLSGVDCTGLAMSCRQWRAQGVGFGGAERRRRSIWCIIAVDILGAGTGVCPPQARSTEATRVAYL